MRDQVNIYRYTTASDGAGGLIETQATLRRNSYIDIDVQTVSTTLGTGEYVTNKVINCRLRYRTDLPIQDNDVIEWKGTKYVARGVAEVGDDRNRFQTFTSTCDRDWETSLS